MQEMGVRPSSQVYGPRGLRRRSAARACALRPSDQRSIFAFSSLSGHSPSASKSDGAAGIQRGVTEGLTLTFKGLALLVTKAPSAIETPRQVTSSPPVRKSAIAGGGSNYSAWARQSTPRFWRNQRVQGELLHKIPSHTLAQSRMQSEHQRRLYRS